MTFSFTPSAPLSTLPHYHLKELAAAIKRDPMGWRHWKAVYFSVCQEDSGDHHQLPHEEIESLLRVYCQHHDHAIYSGEASSMVIMVHQVDMMTLRHFMRELSHHLKHEHQQLLDIQFYPLEHDWKRFVFLSERIRSDTPDQQISYAESNLNEKLILDHTKREELFQLYENSRRQQYFRDRPKVLVIDDDSLTRRIVSKVLKNEAEIITAKDVYEGLIDFAIHAPDIIFLDIQINSAQDGKAFLNTIREHEAHIHIVMFSANDYIENRIETLQMGANGFVSKPFRKEDLMLYIQKAAGNC